MTAARKIDEPNGRSRFRSSRWSSRDSPIRTLSARGDTWGSLLSGCWPPRPCSRRRARSATKSGNTAPKAYVDRATREPRALDHSLERGSGVAAMVSRAYVVVRPGPLVGGHGQQHPSAGSQHPRQLRDGQGVVLTVLDHVEGSDHVERLVREGQRLGRATDALAGDEPVGEEVEGHPGMVAAHPVHARSVGAAHVQRPSRGAQERPEDHVQEVGAGAEPPVVRLAQ